MLVIPVERLEDCAANKKPLDRGLAAAGCDVSLPDQWPDRLTGAHPATKLGQEYTHAPRQGQLHLPERKRPA